jgi:hypothetical protein
MKFEIGEKTNIVIYQNVSKATNINLILRRVWRYQRGHRNPYIKEEQTTHLPNEKVQKDKQRSTNHTYTTKDRVTRTPQKTGGELRFFGRVSRSCSTSGTRRVNLVTNPVMHLEWRTGKCLRQGECFCGHLWQRYSIAVNQVMVATTTFTKWWLQLTKRDPWFSRFLVSSNPLSRKLW